MLELVVQVLLIILGTVIAPCVAWLIHKVIATEVAVAKIGVEVAGIQQRCVDRQEWLKEIAGDVSRSARNIERIGTKLSVDLIEE